MKEDLITFEASSPDELKEMLSKLTRKDTRSCLYCALAIGDPEFLIYPFNFRNTTRANAKKQVINEIKAIYEMPVSEIEYDFQIFDEEENYISGVCAAIPKKRLAQYLDILDTNRLVPLNIIPYSAATIGYYFHLHKDPQSTFAIVDFSRKHVVSMAVFEDDTCQLLRQIAYESLHDIVTEIKDSLKNAFLFSGIEHVDRVHFAGNLEDKLDIISDIETAFQAKAERDHSVDIMTALSIPDRYFTVELSRHYTFSTAERSHALKLTALLMGLYCLFVIYLGSEIFFKIKELNELNASYKLTDYDYAKNLKQELDAL
ncbi:MAG: hypothetical protein JW847_01660 [Candidatus Omnitrophica bacterium]|nr:hypothetical protein [Candidatus Omnitrophota bacterium]